MEEDFCFAQQNQSTSIKVLSPQRGTILGVDKGKEDTIK